MMGSTSEELREGRVGFVSFKEQTGAGQGPIGHRTGTDWDGPDVAEIASPVSFDGGPATAVMGRGCGRVAG